MLWRHGDKGEALHGAGQDVEVVERDTAYIEDRITADGSGEHEWPVEPGRYRLVVARACPWANRATIVRRLLGLEDALSMALCGPTHDADSWTFDLDPGEVDPVLGIARLKDAYEARFPGYPKGITVPAVVDVPSGKVVTNDFPQITLDLSTQWHEHHRAGAPDLYPQALRAQIGRAERLGLLRGQQRRLPVRLRGLRAYDRAYERLFTALDPEERLSTRATSSVTRVTEADVRLFTTLARFDAVYHGHFKCNRSTLSEMPVLWA